MQFFDIQTIKDAIEHLSEYPGNWIIPTFVFAANDAGRGRMVDMAEVQGTDKFLDKYFNGSQLGIPYTTNGNNLLRPRFKDVTGWQRGPFAGDHVIRQDTKMWGNLFSSRGYREMRQRGEIRGEKTVVEITEAFKPAFEAAVAATFRFEDFLVWLFAFDGFPDGIDSWQELYEHLLATLGLESFRAPYRGRFVIRNKVPWPKRLNARPSNEDMLAQLAPKLMASLKEPPAPPTVTVGGPNLPDLPDDDPTYLEMLGAINSGESLAFLLAGPPGTGKTRLARQLANKFAEKDPDRVLFLQFHPAIGYDDFVEGFRPVEVSAGSGVRYELAPRLLLKFADIAAENPGRKFVVVIDELNRGDVARVFGELLTYIEADYRGQTFTLPYSGRSGTLPPDLIFIATANPFDRSVTDLDDALLRRFWVISVEPSAETLRSHLEKAEVDDALVRRIVRMFTLVHEAMPHGFGHSNFLRVRSVEDLGAVWLGRVRMGLRRALTHDPRQFTAVSDEIEALLARPEDVEEPEEEDAPSPGMG